MAALYDPRYDFTPAHTAGDRSIALAERDPAYLQFKQTAMKKYSNLSPVAIANLFHRSKEQRNILPSLDVDALAENAIEAETAAPPASTSDANPVFHMGIGNIAALEAKQNDERNALGALDEYYSNMTADQYAQEVAAQKNLTPTLSAADRIKEQQERERLALALSAPPEQAADVPVLSAESSSYDHIPFTANAETQDFSQQTGPYFPEMPVAPPALATPNENGTDNGTVVTDSTGPVLRQPTSNTARNGNAARRMTGGYTGNARGSDLPDMQIGLNERLMRMGAAGLAAGGQGSLAQMGAMFGASADVNQANRQAEMEAFGIEEERRQAHAARVAALAASKNKGAGGGGDEAKVAGIALDNARAVLQGFDKYDGFASPVGWSYWIRQGWDNINGNEQAAIRLKIAKMKVDSTLARVAQTKGAISEREMDIFMSDQPSWTSDEKVWRDWIDSYIAALTTMHTNLSTGQTPYKNGGGGGSTVTVINGMKFTETTPKTAK